MVLELSTKRLLCSSSLWSYYKGGSRNESDKEQGLAHFIEHVIFKGTSKRKAYHILSRMEDVGGELNAFTTKEETCIYSSFLPEYYNRALELLSDITFSSIFPKKELEKEKIVVLDEINYYKDNPQNSYLMSLKNKFLVTTHLEKIFWARLNTFDRLTKL